MRIHEYKPISVEEYQDRSHEVKRYYLMVLILSVVIILVLIAMMVIVTRYKPQLVVVEFNTQTGKYHVMKEDAPEQQIFLHTVGMLKNYVIDRYTVDFIQDNIRRQRVGNMSTQDVYAELVQEIEISKQFSGDYRMVRIMSDRATYRETNRGIHEIDIQLIDQKGEETKQREYRAIIQWQRDPSALSQSSKSIVEENPFGVFVTNYQLIDRDIHITQTQESSHENY